MKRVLRLVVMVPGLLYLWALLPLSFRPEFTGSPFRKPDPTVTLAAPGAKVLSQGALTSACEAPRLLRPIVRPARQVIVRYTDHGKVVSQTRVNCDKAGPSAKSLAG